MTDQTPSGNRWEPTYPVSARAPGDPVPSSRPDSGPDSAAGSHRARWAGAAAALFLGSAVGGYAIGHEWSDDAPPHDVFGRNIVLGLPSGEGA